MELNALMRIQEEFDRAHGWTIDGDERALIQATSDDLVGLLGELGEFANIIKTANIKLDQ